MQLVLGSIDAVVRICGISNMIVKCVYLVSLIVWFIFVRGVVAGMMKADVYVYGIINFLQMLVN